MQVHLVKHLGPDWRHMKTSVNRPSQNIDLQVITFTFELNLINIFIMTHEDTLVHADIQKNSTHQGRNCADCSDSKKVTINSFATKK